MSNVVSIVKKPLLILLMLLGLSYVMSLAGVTQGGLFGSLWRGGCVVVAVCAFADFRFARHLAKSKGLVVTEQSAVGMAGLYAIEVEKWVLSLAGLVWQLKVADGGKGFVLIGFVVATVAYRLATVLQEWNRRSD